MLALSTFSFKEIRLYPRWCLKITADILVGMLVVAIHLNCTLDTQTIDQIGLHSIMITMNLNNYNCYYIHLQLDVKLNSREIFYVKNT